jgi:membrane fusion protein, multidrug efflux system
MKGLRRILTTLALGGLVVGAWFVVASQIQQPQHGHRTATNADQPVPVRAAPARNADVPVYLEGVGTTRALNMVMARSQVDGTLLTINFREGQDVKKGDLLAKIDPTIYQALLDQAIGKKALDEASLANAKVDLERYANLIKNNSVPRQQLDTQKALVAQLEAQITIDQGAIDNARANLNYTSITSPIAGRTGIRLVDEGNLIHATDTTGIVVITQIQPIAILFTLPQQQLGQVNKAFAAGPLSIEAIDADNKTVLDHGTLRVVNNQVDQTTGTVQFKAEFPNADLQLWPGQFVNVRLLINTLHQVVVVPTAAVQRGPNGTFVYVVRPDSTVTVRPVTVTQQDDSQAVIANGVQASDNVVVSGFTRLTEGRKVAVSSADSPAAAPAATRPAPGSFDHTSATDPSVTR